jgi:hypothetical protein
LPILQFFAHKANFFNFILSSVIANYSWRGGTACSPQRPQLEELSLRKENPEISSFGLQGHS